MVTLHDFFIANTKGLSVVVGNLGSGKTLFTTILLYHHYLEGFNVYANYPLFFPKSKKAEIYEIHSFEDIEEAQNGIMAIDEAYTLFDSRRSSSKRNILSTELIRKSRKKSLRVISIAQQYGLIDLRVRKLANNIMFPTIYKVGYDKEGIPYPKALKIFWLKRDDFGVLRYYKTIYVKVHKLYLQLYDTNADVFDIE